MSWNPFYPLTPQDLNVAAHTLLRIKSDLKSILNEPLPGIVIVPDDNDITLVHALITGNHGTPYEGGFFYFILRFPSDYPIQPPKVRFMTTGGDRVRFNPNFYRNGMVCLSILGTWSGPMWSPAQTLSSVLVSIQSLFSENPYYNEPGFERERLPGDVDRYNVIIQHETLRVAVVGMLENDYGICLPDKFVEVMNNSFIELYDFYVGLAVSKIDLDGTIMNDPFGERREYFQYKCILERLKKILLRLEKTLSLTGESNNSSPTATVAESVD